MESLGLKTLFGGSYAGRRVLVTGHTGFKGSWLCLWLQAMGARVHGLALAPDSADAHWNTLALAEVVDDRVDLRDLDAVRACVRRAQPEVVFHLAAQPLVRRSYDDPISTFATNVTGLVNLLECLRDSPGLLAVVNATTDKVYLEQATASGYSEAHPLGGHDPYSTSKACAELVSECYRKSFFRGAHPERARLATARAGNVIGGGDWAEDRLVPDLVRAASTGTPLRLRNPDAVRPWQHVLEPLSGYLRLGQGLLSGQDVEGPWNFGPAGDATMSVTALVDRLQAHWPGLVTLQETGAHPHEAGILRLDCSKAADRLGWRPTWSAAETVARTIRWYRTFATSNRVLSTEDLSAYVQDARAAGQQWAIA